jgi:hypothetical protein
MMTLPSMPIRARKERSSSKSIKNRFPKKGVARAVGHWLGTIAILVGHATRCALSVIRFKQGKWRSIAVDIEPKAKKSAS